MKIIITNTVTDEQFSVDVLDSQCIAPLMKVFNTVSMEPFDYELDEESSDIINESLSF